MQEPEQTPFDSLYLERSKEDHGHLAFLENYDIFEYTAPNKSTRSQYGGFFSLLSVAFFVVLFISNIQKIVNDQYVYSTDIGAQLVQNTNVPDIAIVIKDENIPMYNESIYSLSMQYNTLYEADTNPLKPRERTNIPLIPCNVTLGQGYASIEARCPDYANASPKPLDNLVVQGKFEDILYKYASIELIPCANSFVEIANSNGSCSPDAVARLYSGEVTMNMWSYGHVSTFEKAWKPILYENTYDRWQGFEMFFLYTAATKYNRYGVEDSSVEYMKYDHTTIRHKPIQQNLDGTLQDMLKVYLRSMDHAETIEISHFTFFNLLESLGGLWSLMMLFLGSVALNFNKKRYDKIMEIESKHTKLEKQEEDDEIIRDTLKDLDSKHGIIEMMGIHHSPMHNLNLSDPIPKEQLAHNSRSASTPPSTSSSSSAAASSENNNNNNFSQSSHVRFESVFTVADMHGIFSSGFNAPRVSFNFVRAALSRTLRSHRIFPLTQEEVWEVVSIYVPPPPSSWIEAARYKADVFQGQKVFEFKSYHELCDRFNLVLRKRQMLRGKILMRMGGNYCAIETSLPNPTSVNKVTASQKRIPSGQDLFIEKDTQGYFYFKDNRGYYLEKEGEWLRFTTNPRNALSRFEVIFDDLGSKCSISVASASDSNTTSTSTSKLRRSVISKDGEIPGILGLGPATDMSEPIVDHPFQFFLYYHTDVPLMNFEVDALCAGVGSIQSL